jgi:hypothetical protein
MAETKVKLKSESLGETRDFDILHAEALLKCQEKLQHDWVLSDNNFTYANGTINRTNKKPAQSTDQRAQSQEGS